MDDLVKHRAAPSDEVTAIIAYLSSGTAELIAKTEATFEMRKKDTPSFLVSAKALTYLARKGWVKRIGMTLHLTKDAPRSLSPVKRETRLCEITENGETRTVTRLAAESPIDYLAARKDKNGVAMLGSAEWNAGDRLRSDFTRANMLPSIGMRWGEPIRGSAGAGGGVTQTDAAVAARLRVTKALESVGPEFSGLLIDVCCFLKGLEKVEIERGWPKRSGKLMLRAGLSILARHYAPASKEAGKIRVWGTENYRPSL